ncbi:MAG: hypothetical protein J5836_01495 [Clostridia bacterium]|nr:hypothetical protein [Clostridia bacterium]
MVTTGIITVSVFILLILSILFLPKVKIGKVEVGTYWIIALLGASAYFICGVVPIERVAEGLTENSAVNPFKILVLFFSMTLISVFLDETGLFEYLANRAVALAGKKQISLFVALYLLTSVLTVFTSNDIVILTLTPIVCFFCKNAKINPIPYLVGEFAAANTWSMALFIGNPTNVYLATKAGIEFLEFSRVMVLPTLAAGVVEFSLVVLIFYKKLKKPVEPTAVSAKIEDKLSLIIGLIHLFICLVLLVLSGRIGVETWLISAACAASLSVSALLVATIKKRGYKRVINTFTRLPWQLIPFVLSMFVIVIGIEYRGIAEWIGNALGDKATVWTYGFSSMIAANLINNIPMSMLFSSVVGGIGKSVYLKAVYATIIGSNIGAFLTPVGALAGIMFTDLTKRCGAEYGFKEFIKYGVIISVPTIAIALLTLSIV